METSELEAKIYAALSGDEQLMRLLPDGAAAIFHMQAASEEYPRTPTLVYSVVSDVPTLHADNAEALHRVVVRIHIITIDGEYAQIYQEIKRVMTELGFTRRQTTPIVGRGRKMLAADFKIVIGG